MKKRVICFVMALLMCLGTAVPMAAAEGAAREITGLHRWGYEWERGAGASVTNVVNVEDVEAYDLHGIAYFRTVTVNAPSVVTVLQGGVTWDDWDVSFGIRKFCGDEENRTLMSPNVPVDTLADLQSCPTFLGVRQWAGFPTPYTASDYGWIRCEDGWDDIKGYWHHVPAGSTFVLQEPGEYFVFWGGSMGAFFNIVVLGDGEEPPVTTHPDPPTPPTDYIGNNHSAWAGPELARAAEKGLIPTMLQPAHVDLTLPISREEFAGVVVAVFENLAHTYALPTIANPFADTNNPYVLRAFNMGLMVGISTTEFAPDTLLTREQAATALTRSFKRATIRTWTFETDANYPLDFTWPEPFADDAHISDWARESVYFMAANGIIQGTGNNMFSPRAVTSAQQAAGYAQATREQALIIALRMVENLG